MLASQPILAHYDCHRPLQIACDASAYGAGAFLSHVSEDEQTHPVAYASRTLTKAEQGYSHLEKAALALVFGVKKFHYYVYARPFTLLTNHKPLETIFGPKTGIPTIAAARLQRWAVALSAYTFTLKFRSAVDNVDADCLSRLPFQHSGVDGSKENFFVLRFNTMPVSSRQTRAETTRDPVLREVVKCILHGWPSRVSEEIKPFFCRKLELFLYHGCIMLGMRVVVPQNCTNGLY